MKEHNIRTTTVEVTPEWAEKKLAELQKLVDEGTFRQRSVNKVIVATYAADMARGAWGITHQGIGFDEYGRLIDGQKRLWAVVKAGVTVRMRVTTGIPADTNGRFALPTMDLVDSGQKRSIGQQLGISHGITSPIQVAAVVRNIGLLYSNDMNLKLSITQTLELLEMYKPNIDAVFSVSSHQRQRVGPIVGPLAIYHSSYPEKAREFAASFFSKEGLKKGSPVLALIKWLELHPHWAGKDILFQKLRVVSYCIHEFHHDKEIDAASPKEEAMYWLGALNKKHAEIIRAMIYPMRKQ